MIIEPQRSILQQQHTHIIYIGSNGQTTQRIVGPLEIIGDRLKANCLTRCAPVNILAPQPVVICHGV